MIIKHYYDNGNPVCNVTFYLSPTMAGYASRIDLVGDFNNWNTEATPMKKAENGTFAVSLDLSKGSEYQFLYLIDRQCWEIDREADKFVKSPYGDSENSVVVV